jgi:hypothetical protein
MGPPSIRKDPLPRYENFFASYQFCKVACNAGAGITIPSLGLPFLLAGGLKVVYDLWMFAVFRNVRPPEEEK